MTCPKRQRLRMSAIPNSAATHTACAFHFRVIRSKTSFGEAFGLVGQIAGEKRSRTAHVRPRRLSRLLTSPRMPSTPWSSRADGVPQRHRRSKHRARGAVDRIGGGLGPGTGNLSDGCDTAINPIRCSTCSSHLTDGHQTPCLVRPSVERYGGKSGQSPRGKRSRQGRK